MYNLPERKSSRTMTAELAAQVKYLIKERGLYQHQVAAMLGVNQGRISEIVTGKKFAETLPADQLLLGLD